MSEKRIVTALYSWVQGSFWMSFCVSVSFAAVYLQGLGYDNTTLGLILCWGRCLDRHYRLLWTENGPSAP